MVRDVKEIEDLEECDESENAVGGGAEDRGHGAELGGSVKVADLAVGAFTQAFDEEENDALEDEDDKQDRDEAGKLVATEVDDVVVPVHRKDMGNAIVLRDQGQKVHDDGVSLSVELL